MADELKIPITIANAAGAKKDLADVAAGERAVVETAKTASPAIAEQTQTSADASAASGDLAKELFGTERAGQEFRKVLSSLPPELSSSIEGIVGLARAGGAAALGMGVLAIAVTGVSFLISKLTEANEKQKELSATMNAALAKQADGYLSVADAIEKARLQQELLGQQTTQEASSSLVQRSSAAAKGTFLGAKGVGELAASAATAGQSLTDEQLRAFALWLSLGRAGDVSDPADRLAMFLGELAADGALPEKLKRAQQIASERTPELVRSAAGERATQKRGPQASGQAAAAFARAAEIAKAEDPEFTEERIRNAILEGIRARLQLDSPYRDLYGDTRYREDAVRRAEHLIDAYGLGDVQMNMRTGSPVTRDQSGPTLQQIFHGGTHFHSNDKRNPAGAMSRQAAE